MFGHFAGQPLRGFGFEVEGLQRRRQRLHCMTPQPCTKAAGEDGHSWSTHGMSLHEAHIASCCATVHLMKVVAGCCPSAC